MKKNIGPEVLVLFAKKMQKFWRMEKTSCFLEQGPV